MLIAVDSKMDVGDVLNDNNIYTFPDPLPNYKIVKRETDNLEKLREFMEKKLTRQNQALERILNKVNKQGVLLEQLTDQLSTTLEMSQSHKRISPLLEEKPQRRSNAYEDKEQPVYEEKEHPIISFGKNISLFRRLARDFFTGEFKNDTDPTPLLEDNPDVTTESESYRRSAGGNPDLPQTDKWDWCELAKRCEKTGPTHATICGFDDMYGYGRFIDMCHMFNVNCFYKFNFVLAYTCNPTIHLWE